MKPDELTQSVRNALAEDIGQGDITAALTPPAARARAAVRIKEDAIVCGADWFNEAFRQLDPSIQIDWDCRDGDRLTAGTRVCTLLGPTQAILTGERTALNFLQTLSATATSAARYVDAIRGTSATVLDTRKTLPGLRLAQKYAVRCGGATNHRIGLFDAILIKENHILAMGSIDAAIAKARASAGSVLVEVEVETMQQVSTALESSADRLLLDNFSLDMLREAVALRDTAGSSKTLEASGGISLESIRDVAETGVDFISVGEMTKSVRAIDYSLRIVEAV